MVPIRPASMEDLPAVYQLIHELADYEKAPEAVTLSFAQFRQDYQQQAPPFSILVAEVDRAVVGMALYFFTYSTWKGSCLYLEDMIITAAHRQQGIGKALFEQLLKAGAEAGVARMAWQVLDWNTPAIRFYQRYEATLEQEWLSGKLRGDQVSAWLPDDGI